MNKRVTAIGLTAGLLAGAGAGLILEMSGNAGAASNAAAVVVAPDDTTDTGTVDPAVQVDHTARLQEVLQPLVDAGTLTQAQVDEVIAALEAAGPIGGRHGGPGGPGGPGMGGRGMGGGLETVATTLGLTTDEVRTAIQGGQTIAELAEANGASAQAVIDALVAEVKAHLDEEVAAGEHTQADADARLAEATTRITTFVNDTQSVGPMGGPGMGGRGHGPGDIDGDGDTGSGSTGSSGSIDGGPSDSGTDTTAAGA